MARLVSDIPRPAAPAPPPRVEPAFDASALAAVMAAAIREIKLPSPQVTVQSSAPPQVKVMPSESPKQWKFVVKRDKEGYISEITAKAE